MRLALLSDIHGNPIALDAVLVDIEREGDVDAYWVLGDLVAIGHDPVGVVERLMALSNVRFVRGNTDRYVVTGDRPPPTVAQAQANPHLVPQLVEVTSGFAWTQGQIIAAGWLDWLGALPLEARLTLPDGTRMLGVHAAPGMDDGQGVHPTLSDEALRTLVKGCEAELVCVGHVHWPGDRWVGGVRVVNLGSVGNPLAPDLRASYVLLEASALSYRLWHRRVDYDVQRVIDAVWASRHPASGFIVQHYQGLRRPPWD
jgi:predicted phosphodiesterase